MRSRNAFSRYQKTSFRSIRALYPALHRLEDRGWLQAEWKASETGREAKFYALTKKGRKQLDAEVLNWGKLSEAVALVLRTAE
jgi:PadR family transcriptional regulator PadR